MVDSPSVLLAVGAGFVSFVSPCCLPLVPGYLAAMSGATEGGKPPPRARILGRSLLFIASFSLVFVLLGLSATALGAFLFDNQLTLNKVAGGAIIVMGALFIASVFVVRLNRDWRPAGLIRRAGSGGPVLTGVTFAVAWTPCVGPTLGAILGLASTQQSTAQGAGLLLAYSAGLGVPFLLSAFAFDGVQRRLGFLRRHQAAFQVGAGAVLIAMGALVVSGELFRLNVEVQRALEELGLNFFQSI